MYLQSASCYHLTSLVCWKISLDFNLYPMRNTTAWRPVCKKVQKLRRGFLPAMSAVWLVSRE
uniref:Putative ovule protein n=1 Tax=Solanum chacoense TaxID=4108 RepID=A0A0V0GHZ5_SOLCH